MKITCCKPVGFLDRNAVKKNGDVMKTFALTVPIPSDMLLSFNQTPEEFSDNLKLWAAVSMYYFGKISLGRAASLAGYHRYDFEKILARLHIPISVLDEKDAENELNILKGFS